MDAENSRQTVESLHIIDGDGKTIFSGNNYIIPLYQRAFAWSDKEISQLRPRVYQSQHRQYRQVRAQRRPRHVQLVGNVLSRNRTMLLDDIQNRSLPFR